MAACGDEYANERRERCAGVPVHLSPPSPMELGSMLSRPRQFPVPQPGSAAINPHQIAVISHCRKFTVGNAAIAFLAQRSHSLLDLVDDMICGRARCRIYILARALFAIDPRIGRSVDPSGCRAGISRDLLLPFLSSNHRHSPWGAPMTCAAKRPLRG